MIFDKWSKGAIGVVAVLFSLVAVIVLLSSIEVLKAVFASALIVLSYAILINYKQRTEDELRKEKQELIEFMKLEEQKDTMVHDVGREEEK